MYKVMKATECLFLGPINKCIDYVMRTNRGSTVAELRKAGWLITPARRTPIWKVLKDMEGVI